MKHIIIIAAILFSLNSLAQKKKPASVGCGARETLKTSDLTESGLRTWLEQAKGSVTKVEDFVCCLPPELRNQYLVSHSSFAAQNAVPRSPRIIFFQNRTEQKPFAALTVNGGDHPALTQVHSVEIAIENKKTKELEYFDLEFLENEGPHLSERNATLCLSCHGVNGTLPVGGLRPVFDPLTQVNRFVGGRSPFCSDTEKELHRALDETAVESMKKNIRYSCLDQAQIDQILNPDPKADKTSPTMFRRIEEFSQNVNALNEIRTARAIRSEPVFRELRSGFLGLYTCGGKLEEWLSDETLKRLKAREFLKASYRGENWQESFKNDLLAMEKKLTQERGRVLSDLKNREKTLDMGIDPLAPTEVRCEGGTALASQPVLDGQGRSFPTSLRVQWTADTLSWVRPLQAQWLVDAVKGDIVLTGIMQAWGVDTMTWQMSAVKEGALSDPRPVEEALRQEWNSDRTWRKKMSDYFTVSKKNSHTQAVLKMSADTYLHPKSQESCADLLNYTKSVYAKGRTPNAAK